jgi:hypothetical protein
VDPLERYRGAIGVPSEHAFDLRRLPAELGFVLVAKTKGLSAVFDFAVDAD